MGWRGWVGLISMPLFKLLTNRTVANKGGDERGNPDSELFFRAGESRSRRAVRLCLSMK